MTLFTKQALISRISRSGIERITSMDQDAADLVNAILDKIIEKLFPKGSSAVLEQVKNRVTKLAKMRGSIFEEISESLEDDRTTGIPLSSINRAIRSHAGNISVPLETQSYVDNLLDSVLSSFLLHVLEEEGVIPLPSAKLEGKHILKYLFETEEGLRSALHNPPIGPLGKDGKSKKSKRKSKSKKSGSRKRCPPRQISVRGFVRDGKRIKSYCRKKSSKK
jgi:hypothetical protein